MYKNISTVNGGSYSDDIKFINEAESFVVAIVV